ncbi:hypothetical protein HUZ36_05010 [Pseudoalteromonas sp. McH1-7]|uniref:hypothetical protein n=1 Tax=unclassified Pseudoalteromonas TaxID=194690 RepID=UPI0015904A14|nr:MULTISPECIES: hypothetical protein [unclassified Pseudoalteromonas]NUZ10133.1 hypothetical protein [Pseudoalteromonas sp. McH1-7]USD30667.1 hypothetical protein J8Z24_16935 [Pseudoalteromonas sp. SCSIO 43201]
MKRFSLSAMLSLLILLWVGAAYATELDCNTASPISVTKSMSITDDAIQLPVNQPDQHKQVMPFKLSHDDNDHDTGFLPERERSNHPSYFLHPKQQAEYALAFALAEPKYVPTMVYQMEKPNDLPWYMSDTRPANGSIDTCKPANLIFKGRLSYDV